MDEVIKEDIACTRKKIEELAKKKKSLKNKEVKNAGEEYLLQSIEIDLEKLKSQERKLKESFPEFFPDA